MKAVIQHHPARAHLIPFLLDSLPGAEVVTDPDPQGVRSPWRCYRVCLERAVELGGAVIVQDDAQPCPHFLEVAARAAAVHPGDPVAFFATGPYPIAGEMKKSQAEGRRFARVDKGMANSFIPVVATFWPQEAAAHLLEWAEHHFPRSKDGMAGYRADDGVTGRWLRRCRKTAWVTVPCLVEHPDVEPTLIERRSDLIKNRKKRPARMAAVKWSGDPREIVWQ